MRYKIVPGPVDYDRLLATRDALPLVPGRVEDCCARIRDRTDVPSRDEAREWLTFLTALGLAAETDRGFHRVRDEPEPDSVADAFVANVFGVREILDVLGTEQPLSPHDVFEEVRGVVPRWERDRYPDWEREWEGKLERLLGWSSEFGLVERRDGGYVRAGD